MHSPNRHLATTCTPLVEVDIEVLAEVEAVPLADEPPVLLLVVVVVAVSVALVDTDVVVASSDDAVGLGTPGIYNEPPLPNQQSSNMCVLCA